METEDGESLHRLEGSTGQEKGGLVIMKKKGPSEDSPVHTFKKPSLLGLDKLAAAKRKKDGEESKEIKKSRVLSYKDDEDEIADDSFETSDKGKKDRYFSILISGPHILTL